MITRPLNAVGLAALLALALILTATCGGTDGSDTETAFESTTTSLTEPPQASTTTLPAPPPVEEQPSPGPTPAPTPDPTPEPPPSIGPCGGPVPTEPAEFDAAIKSIRSEGWLTGDLLDRVRLDEDRFLWVFADSFYGELAEDGAFLPGWYIVNSSAILQDQDCFELVSGYGERSWIPPPGDGEWKWPQDGLVIDGVLHLFSMDVIDATSDVYWGNFQQVGGTVVDFRLDNLSFPDAMVPGLPHIRGNSFGFGAFLDDGYIYLYAHEEGTGTYVGRLEEGQVHNPQSMTFWDGASWTPDVNQAVSVAEHRLRVFPHKDGFGAAALPFFDARLHLYTSETPVGPWTLRDQVELDFIAPDAPSWIYEPLIIEPTGADPDSDAVVFAVNFLQVDPQDYLDDANRYGPRFLTVELPNWSDPE